MPARVKRTAGQEAAAANHEFERYAGGLIRRLWDWYDDALTTGERSLAVEIDGILADARCFLGEWGGIAERINAIAHAPPARAAEPPTQAEPAEPAVPSPKKRIKKVVR